LKVSSKLVTNLLKVQNKKQICKINFTALSMLHM